MITPEEFDRHFDEVLGMTVNEAVASLARAACRSIGSNAQAQERRAERLARRRAIAAANAAEIAAYNDRLRDEAARLRAETMAA